MNVVHLVLQIELLAVDHQSHDAECQRPEKEEGEKVGRHLETFDFLICSEVVVAAIDPFACPDNAVDAEGQDIEHYVKEQSGGFFAVGLTGDVRFFGECVDQIPVVDSKSDEVQEECFPEASVSTKHN